MVISSSYNDIINVQIPDMIYLGDRDDQFNLNAHDVNVLGGLGRMFFI